MQRLLPPTMFKFIWNGFIKLRTEFKALLIGGGLALLLVLTYKKGIKYLIRGLKNHNPGNLRISDVPWQHKVSEDQNTDGAFEQFEDGDGQEADFWGLRANMINILAKFENGANTLERLGEVWAPASDNGGDNSYGKHLGSTLDFDPTAPYDVPSNLAAVMHAICINENGIDPYDDSLIASAAISALQSKGYT